MLFLIKTDKTIQSSKKCLSWKVLILQWVLRVEETWRDISIAMKSSNRVEIGMKDVKTGFEKEKETSFRVNYKVV